MYQELSVCISTHEKGNIDYSVIVDGLFMYKDNTSTKGSVEAFIKEYSNGKQDFNECYGVFRFSMTRKDTGEKLCFADNSGMMRYYIDQSRQKLFVSLAESKALNERKANYRAIAQFLAYGCVYDEETIIKSVFYSNPNCYYVLNENKITTHSKSLNSLFEYRECDITLHTLIEKATKHCEGRIGCTITGGIDSRSVLANLISINTKPELTITGHESQDDVIIARKIAKATGLNLTIISDGIDENDWLDHSIEAADGQEGICEIYRLNKQARYLKQNKIELQFGGVAGEMYKNSFINQDFPIYFGKPNWDKFYKYKVGTFDYNKSYFSDEMQEELKKLKDSISEWLKKNKGCNKADTYNNAGYSIMQARCNHVINMFERYTTVYNPLMERKLAAYSFGKDPYKLENQAYQRQQVSQYCEKFKNIETDRGLTCNYNRRFIESIKSYLFLIKVASQRLLYRKKIDIRIDECFTEGHKDGQFFRALENTKNLGILNQNISINEVPIGLADRLFTIGLFFSCEE